MPTAVQAAWLAQARYFQPIFAFPTRPLAAVFLLDEGFLHRDSLHAIAGGIAQLVERLVSNDFLKFYDCSGLVWTQRDRSDAKTNRPVGMTVQDRAGL